MLFHNVQFLVSIINFLKNIKRSPWYNCYASEEVLVRPAGGAHPVVCVGPNAPV